ncbi:hypothetical protein K402DRAFT_397444 [Aulographum hederae CBS 113979]|uniref:Uncharacterized protein n=1 Tax=Aulographum hederae CBS 113979 TaxID=1176131 RepID=A0A6G1GNJ5_9PEZI|nr:hypothetical protein K402DRAFT_397444 [Aulographum hederae CBS 113979]
MKGDSRNTLKPTILYPSSLILLVASSIALSTFAGSVSTCTRGSWGGRPIERMESFGLDMVVYVNLNKWGVEGIEMGWLEFGREVFWHVGFSEEVGWKIRGI